jgi:prevent-host-death family protein
MSNAWTVEDAKTQLSELLRRARAGEPQRIGLADDACVLVSARDGEARHPSALGAWLVESAPRGAECEAPSRRTRRGDPFENEGDAASKR